MLLYFISALLFINCKNTNQKLVSSDKHIKSESEQIELIQKNKKYKTAYFASGCFWCVEAIYESVKGVKESISGYSGGFTENPTYKSSNTGRTGHAEAVEVYYDPEIVSFASLVDVYFASQNPIQFNGQGPDIGSQYRSIIFYQNEKEKEIINNKIKTLSKKLNHKIAAEVVPFDKFWKAEAYHQDYEKRNPTNGYIQNVSIPRLKSFQSKLPHLIKKSH